MFASPLKQSTNSRRAVNVQVITKEEYAGIATQPVLVAGSRSTPASHTLLPLPIPREDLAIKVAREVPRPPLEEPRRPLEPISPYALLISEILSHSGLKEALLGLFWTIFNGPAGPNPLPETPSMVRHLRFNSQSSNGTIRRAFSIRLARKENLHSRLTLSTMKMMRLQTVSTLSNLQVGDF
jgi:hypothetical protein